MAVNHVRVRWKLVLETGFNEGKRKLN